MQINKIEAAPKLPKLLNVAAYARVSDGKEAMLHSLAAQVDYYTDLIAGNPEWAFGGVFCDEALTGTKETRPEFQRLLAECRAGKIDMVITKSISRLARNTVTILSSVRELKNLDVDIFFEEQNIHSLSGDGELMLSILSSYAQEESRSCSENCKWRVRKNFSEGKVGGMTMFGFRLKNGQLQVVPEEAAVVREVFSDYLSGMGVTAIMKKYRAKGFTFSKTGLSGMLRNEKFQGDMLLQKSFVEDHISKRKVKNIGQLPQYLVEESHEAIIDKSTFAAVQAEIARRAARFNPKPKAPAAYPYTGLIRCGKCGAAYKRKHAAAGSKYEKIVWICTAFDTLGKAECDSQQIPEDILEAKIAEVGGLALIAEIRAPGQNRLNFILKDGTTQELAWAHPSRRQSWTPEMREAARQKSLERSAKNHGKT
jgi:DNA invertase Pin-like site-specific DNA recombinase